MFSIAAWNIRGLNVLPKQKEVQEVMVSNGLSICAVLESHVLLPKLQNVCSRVFSGWDWVSNNQQGSRGTRIIVGWDTNRTNLMVLSKSDQVIHCQVFIIAENKSFFCSFSYAGNSHAHRRELWSNLCMHKQMVGNNPWVLGDFNIGLNIEDHSIGSSGISLGMLEFRDFMDLLGVEDMNSTGYTSQGIKDQMRVLEY